MGGVACGRRATASWKRTLPICSLVADRVIGFLFPLSLLGEGLGRGSDDLHPLLFPCVSQGQYEWKGLFLSSPHPNPLPEGEGSYLFPITTPLISNPPHR